MPLTKWTPTTDLMMLRRMGKLSEELAELSNVAARCIIQGINEVDPSSGKVNRLRLEHEIADVLAQCETTIQALRLDQNFITERKMDKMAQMEEWEAMFESSEGSAAEPLFVVDHVGISYGSGPDKTTVVVGHSANTKSLSKGTKLYSK